MFGLVSKKKYNQLSNINDELKLNTNVLQKKIEEKDKLIEELTSLKSKYEQMIINFDKQVTILKKDYTDKEKQRRALAGRCGGYKKELNKYVLKNKEMMDLINKLIIDRQTILKLKKKPTLEEIKNYFR